MILIGLTGGIATGKTTAVRHVLSLDEGPRVAARASLLPRRSHGEGDGNKETSDQSQRDEPSNDNQTPGAVPTKTGSSAAATAAHPSLSVGRGGTISVLDCDALVHELQAPHSSCVRAIEKAFPGVVDPTTGVLDRAALGAIVFGDPNARRRLQGIMNKRIMWAIIKKICGMWWASPAGHILVLDAPILYETGILVHIVSCVLVVCCEPETQLARLIARNRFTPEEAQQRIDAQFSMAEKRRRADYVIENNASAGIETVLKARVAEAVAWVRQTQRPTRFPHKCILGVSLCVALLIGGTATALGVLL